MAVAAVVGVIFVGPPFGSSVFYYENPFRVLCLTRERRGLCPTALTGVYVSAVPYPSRPHRRKSDPEPASALVSAVVGSIGGNWRGREHQVFAVYTDIGGDFLRKHTRPDAMRDGTLFVRVSSSAIAHHLTLLRGEILKRMAPLLPPGMVTDIRTRVGPLG